MIDELHYMINAARYLSLDVEKQLSMMEWFARWDLAEEIGMEWIDAKGIIYSKELAQTISTEAVHLLATILNNFECAFNDSMKKDVWTIDAMYRHPFWEEQRSLSRPLFIEEEDIFVDFLLY